jgi:hypothetical protein
LRIPSPPTEESSPGPPPPLLNIVGPVTGAILAIIPLRFEIRTWDGLSMARPFIRLLAWIPWITLFLLLVISLLL